MMKQMGLNPKHMPKNMPGAAMPDMSALQDMMGQAGMPICQLWRSQAPDMSQGMFGGGLEGKQSFYASKYEQNGQANEKNKKKRKGQQNKSRITFYVACF